VAASCVFFAFLHGELWESFVMMGILGIGLGTTYAAIPGLIVRSVPPRETGSAMGFYQVVRYVGFSLGSAVTASILTSHTSSSTGRPDLVGYTTVFWAAAAICILAALLAWVVSVRGERDEAPGSTLDDDEVRLLEQTEGEDLVVGSEPR
jgi:MFS family permease